MVSSDNIVDEIAKIMHKTFFKHKTLLCDTAVDNFDLIEYIQINFDLKPYDYIVTIGSNDTITANALSSIVDNIDKNNPVLITADEDRLYDYDYIAPYYKNDYLDDFHITDKQLLRNLIVIKVNEINHLRHENLRETLCVIPKVLYHYRVLKETQNYSNNIMPIAFYLPQFHPIPENDEWWGAGFTEWTNVRRAFPMFKDHYQPHEPERLGYYDLVVDCNIQRAQIDLAREYGIYGFCYYYYWFNGKRLLEKPFNRFLDDASLDFPFCICWANENWTRRWDGAENELLIQQVHDENSDREFILDIIPLFKDSRYIKVGNAPLLVIYRPSLFPDFEKTVTMWREICKQHEIHELHISCVQSFGFLNPCIVGADSAVEFPPHKRSGNKDINSIVEDLSAEFSGRIEDYRLYARTFMHIRKNNYILYRGIMLGWDNTARCLNKSRIFHFTSPSEYEKWLISLVDYTARYPAEKRFIFINAWNEWAEGTHLEPDKKYGTAYLEATLNATKINV